MNIHGDITFSELQRSWNQEFTRLSCEIEGHPLGGGMLKVEPGEAARVVVKRKSSTASETKLIREGVETMGWWRHHG